MLVLLRVDLQKDFLVKLFGDSLEEKLLILSKHGITQNIIFNKKQTISIHDIIRDIALKRFENKEAQYKRAIISNLCAYFDGFFTERNFLYLNNHNATENYHPALYALIDVALRYNFMDDKLINILIIALKLNNILFSRYANYILYQQLVNKVFNKDLGNISSIKKALLYANFIFSDFIISTENNIISFEKEILHLTELARNAGFTKELFYIYTNISQFYLLLGDLKASKKYAEKAKKLIKHIDDFFSLLQYWYTYSWLNYEMRDCNEGIKAVEEFTKLSEQLSSNKLGKLFANNLKIKFQYLLGRKEQADGLHEETMKKAIQYYHKDTSDILGELEFTKGLMYFNEEQFEMAQKKCNLALKILTKVFGGDIIDLTQAHIHVVLGKIAEHNNNHDKALTNYIKAIKYYNKLSSDRRFITLYEYGELLSNLSSVYYKTKNYYESLKYFRKLIANFGLEHQIVEKLINILPKDFIHKIGSCGN